MSEWCWYYEGDDWVRREIKLGYELSDPISNPFAPLGLSLHPRTGEPAEPNPTRTWSIKSKADWDKLPARCFGMTRPHHPRTGEPAEPNPLPDNPVDYCVTCDGIHDPVRHTRLANMHLNKCRTTDE